jgi:hypothetical protein
MMTDTDRQRLAAILGMLGSAHAGERAAAALQAEAFRRHHNLTWDQLVGGKAIAEDAYVEPPPPPPQQAPEPPPPTPETYGWNGERGLSIAGMGLVFGVALIVLRTLLGSG